MKEELFDLSEEYEAMLNQGLRLSGEGREFFMKGRVAELKRRLPRAHNIRRILDFGCGTGGTSAHLSAVFTESEVVGVDTSENAIIHATEHHGSDRVAFRLIDELRSCDPFDLCYVNGVFHHIKPPVRPDALASIHSVLLPGARLALFENNPWNPGTRAVMARIPFDRDACPISPPATRRLLESCGFEKDPIVWSMFYFPRSLAFLRGLENTLSNLPLGAQYCVLATRV